MNVNQAVLAWQDEKQLHDTVASAIFKQVSSIMALEPSHFPPSTPLTELGLDSLAAIELKSWISRTLRVPLQTTEILGN